MGYIFNHAADLLINKSLIEKLEWILWQEIIMYDGGYLSHTEKGMVDVHAHYVGDGILWKMQELDDVPATCEKYPFNTKIVDGEVVPDENAGEVSLAWGRSGRIYVYIAGLNRVEVYHSLDIMLSGGVL